MANNIITKASQGTYVTSSIHLWRQTRDCGRLCVNWLYVFQPVESMLLFVEFHLTLTLSCLYVGYPDLGLPVFDPLRLEKLNIEQGENFLFDWFKPHKSIIGFFISSLGGNSPVNLKIHLRNFDLIGLSGVKFISIQGFQKEFHNQKMELKFTIPSRQIFGP